MGQAAERESLAAARKGPAAAREALPNPAPAAAREAPAATRESLPHPTPATARKAPAGIAAAPAYSTLAAHYDRIFGSFARWLRPWLVAWVRRLDPRPASALDLACGPGTIAVALARRGLRVQAVDLSRPFVMETRRRARAAKVRVTARIGDMRSFRVARRVDLVTCFFDSINHLPDRRQLTRTFRAVHDALNPGGRFLFDVNTPAALARVWPKMKGIWKGRGWLVVGRGRFIPAPARAGGRRGAEHGRLGRGRLISTPAPVGGRPRPERGRAEFELHWFHRGADGVYVRDLERYHEVSWTDAEIRAALRRAGFVRVRRLRDPALQSAIRTAACNRWFYEARRG